MAELFSSCGATSRGLTVHRVRVVPDDVPLPPIWILGSSGAGAAFAGRLGLGYGFASHFSPTSPLPALRAYRDAFQPSEWFEAPHVIVALSVVCAETDERADYLTTSMDLNWVRLQRNEFGPIPSPEEASAYPYSPLERTIVQNYRALVVTGSPDTVRSRILEIVREPGADEIMVSTMIYSHEERLRSYARWPTRSDQPLRRPHPAAAQAPPSRTGADERPDHTVGPGPMNDRPHTGAADRRTTGLPPGGPPRAKANLRSGARSRLRSCIHGNPEARAFCG